MSLTDAEVRHHIRFKCSMGELAPAVASRMVMALDGGAPPDYARLLHAATFIEPPPIVYHSAPTSARESILLTGLRAHLPESGRWGDLAIAQPVGVYVSAEPDLLGRWVDADQWDVWAIERGDITWGHDTLNPGCWWVSSVPPQRLALVDRP